MKIAIVNINLQWKFPDETTDEEIKDFVENVELPINYVEGSFDFIKIEKE